MAAAKGGNVAALEALAEAGSETGATCSLAGCSGVDSLMLACRWVGGSGGGWLELRRS